MPHHPPGKGYVNSCPNPPPRLTAPHDALNSYNSCWYGCAQLTVRDVRASALAVWHPNARLDGQGDCMAQDFLSDLVATARRLIDESPRFETNATDVAAALGLDPEATGSASTTPSLRPRTGACCACTSGAEYNCPSTSGAPEGSPSDAQTRAGIEPARLFCGWCLVRRSLLSSGRHQVQWSRSARLRTSSAAHTA